MKKHILFAIAWALLLPNLAHAQVQGAPFPNEPLQFFGANGNAIPSGKLCSFLAGTTTPHPLYNDPDLAVGHQISNPMILTSSSRAPSRVYLDANSYKFILYADLPSAPLTCPYTGSIIWTMDQQYDSALLMLSLNNTWSGNQIFNGTVTMTDGLSVTPAINNRQFCSPGSSFTSGFAAAASALPSTGGIVDCSNLQGTETLTSDVFNVTSPKPILVIMPTGTVGATVSVTVPTSMTMEFVNGGILSMANATTATIEGEVRGSVSQHFAGSGSVVLNADANARTIVQYPTWYSGPPSGRLGIDGPANPNAIVTIGNINDNFTNPGGDTIGLFMNNYGTTGHASGGAYGIESAPKLYAPAGFQVGSAAAVTSLPTYLTLGSTFRRAYGFFSQGFDMPAGTLAPFNGADGVAAAAFFVTPTDNGSIDDYVYSILDTGKIDQIGDAPIRFSDTITVARAQLSLVPAPGSYCTGSNVNDFCLSVPGHGFLISTSAATGSVVTMAVLSQGIVEFFNNSGAHGAVEQVFDGTGFGGTGSFAFSSGASGKASFLVDPVSRNAGTGGLDYYTTQIAGSGPVTFTSGTTTRASALRIDTPTFTVSGGAITNGFTLDVAGPPGAGTVRGTAWFESGDVVVGSGIMAQGATSGFLWIPGVSTGIPNGTPAYGFSGTYPFVVDATDNKLCMYIGGGWKCALFS